MEFIKFCFGIFIFAQLGHIESSKILILHPLHGGSHKVQLGHLAKKLIERGHEITTVSFLNVGDVPCQNKSISNNITHYTLTVDNADGRYPYITKEQKGRFKFPLELFWNSGENPHSLPIDAFRVTEGLCKALFGNVQLLRQLQSEGFAACIIDIISNECGLGFAREIGISTIVAYWALFPIGGEIEHLSPSFSPPSYVPSFLSKLSDKMSLPQRMYNTYLRLGSYAVTSIQMFLSLHYMREFSPKMPHPSEMIANLSGVLINSDFSLDYPRLMPPNTVLVGCMQCRDPQPLSKELEDFMSSSGPFGVILFSMGASFNADVARSILPQLFGAFAQLRQRVLMKGKRSSFPPDLQIPPNVKILEWIPQQDILGHPKTRVFFSHMGLHGVLESIWHGVPLIGLPIFGDQFDVIVRLQEKGIAIGLGKDSSELEILGALQNIQNGSYAKRISEYQTLLRDQKEHPMTRAIWFIEYLIRNKGDHLKSSARFLSFYQIYCLDVLLGFLALFGALFIIIIRVIHLLSFIASKINCHVKILFKSGVVPLMKDEIKNGRRNYRKKEQ